MFLSANRLAQLDPLFEIIILAERSVRFLQACGLIVLVLSHVPSWLDVAILCRGDCHGFWECIGFRLALLELRAHLHWITDKTLF